MALNPSRTLMVSAALCMGAGLWLLLADDPEFDRRALEREAGQLRLMADHGGPIELAVTAVNSARHSALRNTGLVTRLANALPESVDLLVLTDDRESMQVASERRAGRVRLLPVPTGRRITIWPQDPFLVMRSAQGAPVLLASRSFERADDSAMASSVADSLGWRVERSELTFEGGNVVASDAVAFVGVNTIRHNAISLGIGDAQAARRFERELGLEVVVIGPLPQPVGHIDLILTALGNKRVALADAGRGAALMESVLEQDPAAVARFEADTQAAFFGAPGIAQLRARDGSQLKPPDLAGRTRAAVRSSFAFGRYLDELAQLLRDRGFEVVRIPFLSSLDGDSADVVESERPTRSALDYPFLTYNNVVTEVVSGVRRVYLPTYGLAALDLAAAQAWERAGYEVVKVSGFAVSALYGGALRCTLKVLRRS